MRGSSTIREIRARRGRGARALRGLDREARTPRLLDLPATLESARRAARVVVVGLGSVGSHVADLLARASVASLLLVDRDRLTPESVLTHAVHPDDIGRPKATVAGERAKALSPETRVRVHDGPVEELSRAALVDATAVLLSSDNLACELEVGRRALHLGVPVIQASVHGPTLVAQVRSLAHADASGPCLACGYGASDWAALDSGTTYSCTGGPAAVADGPPTLSPPELVGTAASLAVTELMARLAGLVPEGESRSIETCGFHHRTDVTPLARRDACPVDHEAWRVVRRRGRLAAATPRRLLEAAGLDVRRGLTDVSLSVEAHRFSRLGFCACPDHPVLERFVPVASADGDATCPSCDAPLAPHPFHTHDRVPGQVLQPHLDRTLGALGASEPPSVTARVGEETFLFVAAGEVRP